MISDVSVTEYLDENGAPCYDVTATFDGTTERPQPHVERIIIPDRAVANRMDFYDLSDPIDALVAILREHYARLNGNPQLPPVEILPDGAHRRKSWRELTPAERGALTGGVSGVPVAFDRRRAPGSLAAIRRPNQSSPNPEGSDVEAPLSG